MGSRSKAIPERWQDYTKVGRPIPGTRIVCFKVPLKTEICRSLPFNQRFTPDMLMDALPDLVGVIDCTNTPRYYDNKELIKNGVQHEKIQCPGHVLPPPHVVQRFKSVMNDLWKVAEPLGKYVGVHCTHGVNRSGYLICRYMIECRGFHPEEAIKLFRESRGHPIERGNYLENLRSLIPNGPLESSDALKQPWRGITREQRHPQQGQWRERNQMENRSQSQQHNPGSYCNGSRNSSISRIQGQYRNPIQQQSYNGYHDSRRNNDNPRKTYGPTVRYPPMYSRSTNSFNAPSRNYPSEQEQRVATYEFHRDVCFENSHNSVMGSSQHNQPNERGINPRYQSNHHQQPQYSQFQQQKYRSNNY